jgi:ergothioneine biosynthesis protein EgtB
MHTDEKRERTRADPVLLPEREPARLGERLSEVRRRTEALCAPLSVEDHVVQSMPDASPAKWHLAHTTWFFEEFVLHAHVPGHRHHEPAWRRLFNSYYQAAGPMHPRAQRGLLSRPGVAEVRAWRARVDLELRELLRERGDHAPLRERIVLGMQHEQQHQELLLTDLQHLFSCNPLEPAYSAARALPAAEAVMQTFLAHAGGVLEIGDAGAGFAFDNERPRHRVLLEPFAIARRPVVNAEFREFVRAGGYRTPSLWLSDGWELVQRERWTEPLYWDESLESQFTLAGRRELAPDAPVSHVSYYEADAFARWAGARLPSEGEWEVVAAGLPSRGNFAEEGWLQPLPAAPAAASEPLQMYGDVWEWTSSAYAPYPGFRPLEGALGEYNGKFMVNQMVLRGGSCLTPAGHVRASYRNFFPPSARWQCSGVRLARDAR